MLLKSRSFESESPFAHSEPELPCQDTWKLEVAPLIAWIYFLEDRQSTSQFLDFRACEILLTCFGSTVVNFWHLWLCCSVLLPIFGNVFGTLDSQPEQAGNTKEIFDLFGHAAEAVLCISVSSEASS